MERAKGFSSEIGKTSLINSRLSEAPKNEHKDNRKRPLFKAMKYNFKGLFLETIKRN